MAKIKIGQIGTLHPHSAGMMGCVRNYPDIFEVVGVVAENEEQREYVCSERFSLHRVYEGVKWMTEEELFSSGVDAIMVEGDEFVNVATAQRCIDHNIPVHIDKPAGDDIKAFEHLLRCAKQKKLVVQMSYMYRYNPGVKYALEQMKNGTLGEIYQVDATMDTQFSPAAREDMKRFPGGIMFFLGCHMVDLVYLFMGKPDNVIPYLKCTGFDGVTAVDHAFATFEYKKGVSFVRTTTTEINGFGRRSLVICGKNATIKMEPIETQDPQEFTKMTLATKEETKGREYYDTKHWVPVAPIGGRYDEMLLDFADFVAGEKENPFTYEYELEVQKLILKACGLDIDISETVL